MDLSERYVQEVGTYLPRDRREQVCDELRAKIDADLADRQAEGSRASREEAEVAVLEDLGPPYQYAESFVPKPRPLFGPRLYPAFFRTLKIAIAALVALAAIGVYVDFASSRSLLSLGPTLLSALGSILGGSVLIVGVAVLVFAVIERTAGAPAVSAEAWDPRSLAMTGDSDEVSLADRISTIAFLVVALLLLNLFRDRIGAYVSLNEEKGWIPFLGPAFGAQVWLLNLCLVLDLIVNFIVLLRWRWTTPLRWANFAVNSLYVFFLSRLAFGPSILGIDPQWMANHGWSPEAIASYDELSRGPLARVVALNLKLGLLAACLGLSYSLFKLLRRSFLRA